MARVSDSRHADADCDEIKFPLGLWKQGEKRNHVLTCSGSSASERWK